MTQTARIPRAPQHLLALERANAVRLARAELKRRVASGELCAADVILDCPWEAESMTLADLLSSQRRWGQHSMPALPAGGPMITEAKTIGALTDRQRRDVAELLEQQDGRRAATLEPALALA